jgi:hypothetical protein
MMEAIVSPKRAPIVAERMTSVLGLLEVEVPITGKPEPFGGGEPDDGEETT